MKDTREALWAAAVLVATTAFCASPWLSPGFAGYAPDAFPIPQQDPPVQPAGWAFAIWGVIYLWLAVSAVFGIAVRAHEPDWTAFRPRLTISLAVGAAWIPVAGISPLVATGLIFVMLVTAIIAFHDAPYLDVWFSRAPLGLFAGWLTAASFVSLGVVLGGYGIMSERGAAVLSLALALLVAAFVLSTVRGTLTYALAMAWALTAISVDALDRDLVVVGLACVGVAFMAAHILRSLRAT